MGRPRAASPRGVRGPVDGLAVPHLGPRSPAAAGAAAAPGGDRGLAPLRRRLVGLRAVLRASSSAAGSGWLLLSGPPPFVSVSHRGGEQALPVGLCAGASRRRGAARPPDGP